MGARDKVGRLVNSSVVMQARVDGDLADWREKQRWER